MNHEVQAVEHVKSPRRETTEDAWRVEAIALFGQDANAWKFVCPCCGNIASVREYIALAPHHPRDAAGMAGYSCIGRLMPKPRDAFDKGPGPCNYAGGGLFQLGPVKVVMNNGTSVQMMEFAR